MFHSVISRILSVATVLTLVLFAANAGLQPAPALASPGISAPLGDTASFLNEDDNGNRGDEDDDNREGNENNENEHENNNENHENDDHDDNDGGTGTTG